MNGRAYEFIASRRRIAVFLAGVLLATAAAPYAASHAAPWGSVDRFTGMPSPVAFEPSYTVLGTTIRIDGTQTLYKFDSVGNIIQRQQHAFQFATIYSTDDLLQTFGAQKYAQLTSGLLQGWWVAAPETDGANGVRFATTRQIRVNSGTRVGVAFYANARVRTRLSVDLSEPGTFDVTRRASFVGRSFYLVASGPLAGRWVSARNATLLGPAVSTSNTVVAPPIATWKAVALVYRETDVTYQRANGSNYRLQARMTDSMHRLVLDTLDRTRRAVADWSNGMAAMSLDVVRVPHPVTSLDAWGDGYWVGPRAVEADLDQYAPPGRYDSVFVIWLPKDGNEVVPVGGWGLTLPPGPWANGAGYSSVITPAWEWWWADSAVPQEVFIHEWLHQVIFFHEDANRTVLDLHAASSFGYEQTNGTWKRWLSDVMQGKVLDGDRYRGLTAELWAAGTPNGN